MGGGEPKEAGSKSPAGGALRRQRYYTPAEVAAHNTPEDCWVSILGGVYDLTPVLREHPGRPAAPIIAAAGTDISHWFDPSNGDIRTRLHPETQLRVPYCPQGEFVDVSPMWPCTGVDCGGRPPWWRDAMLLVGALSAGTRMVRIRNMLTGQEDALEAPGEETVGEVQARYLAANAHAASYTWKALLPRGGAKAADWAELDLNQTLEANGLPDERPAFEAAGLPGADAVPVLHIYWCDDLTAA